MDSPLQFINSDTLSLVIKGIFLLLIAMYAIFVFIVHNHIRSLNKLVHIQKTTGSPLIQTVSIIYLGLAISLFLVAVVIL